MKLCPCCKFINKILKNCLFIILLALCYLMPSRPRFCMALPTNKAKATNEIDKKKIAVPRAMRTNLI